MHTSCPGVTWEDSNEPAQGGPSHDPTPDCVVIQRRTPCHSTKVPNPFRPTKVDKSEDFPGTVFLSEHFRRHSLCRRRLAPREVHDPSRPFLGPDQEPVQKYRILLLVNNELELLTRNLGVTVSTGVPTGPMSTPSRDDEED